MLNIQLIKQTNWFSKKQAFLIKLLLKNIPNKIFVINNNIVIKAKSNCVNNILLLIKNHSLLRYKQLIEIAAEDTPKQKKRFRINYVLSSLLYNNRLIVSTITDELTYLPSITQLFMSAAWLEREVWDMFGIYFRGNKQLRRILTDYGFSGHPLRKDFPMTGFTEIYYALDKKKIVTVPVELAQEYRVFTL